MIHIYTGDGKGKTTAAAGLAVRAAGSGMRVFFVQLLKDGSSSEIPLLRKLGIDVLTCPAGGKFTFQMTDEEKSAASADINSALKQIAAKMTDGSADMIVIDEFFGAYNSGLASPELAETIIASTPDAIELVLTGRNAPDSFISRADYTTRMEKVKHPYDNGKPARKGKKIPQSKGTPFACGSFCVTRSVSRVLSRAAIYLRLPSPASSSRHY